MKKILTCFKIFAVPVLFLAAGAAGLAAVYLHVLGVLSALAPPGPGPAAHVIVVTLQPALTTRHRAPGVTCHYHHHVIITDHSPLLHPLGVTFAFPQLRPGGAISNQQILNIIP